MLSGKLLFQFKLKAIFQSLSSFVLNVSLFLSPRTMRTFPWHEPISTDSFSLFNKKLYMFVTFLMANLAFLCVLSTSYFSFIVSSSPSHKKSSSLDSIELNFLLVLQCLLSYTLFFASRWITSHSVTRLKAKAAVSCGAVLYMVYMAVLTIDLTAKNVLWQCSTSRGAVYYAEQGYSNY